MEARIRRTGWRPCDGPLASLLSYSWESTGPVVWPRRRAVAPRHVSAAVLHGPVCLLHLRTWALLAASPSASRPLCPGTALPWPVLQSRGGRSGPFRGCPLHIGLLDFSLFFLSNEKKFQA